MDYSQLGQNIGGILAIFVLLALMAYCLYRIIKAKDWNWIVVWLIAIGLSFVSNFALIGFILIYLIFRLKDYRKKPHFSKSH